MMKKMKKAAAVFLAAFLAAGLLSGCGGKDASGAGKTGAEETVKINFPTAGASGALYAVGAAVTHMWTNSVPGVQAKSQASAGGIANLNMVADGEAQVSVAVSSNVAECINGTGSFQNHPYKDLKIIAG
ncbi:MAG: TAXI family TRAP transporter solute-binding subunit, partial [Varibaculum cambriense]|nr:TAXI family TRAP transporter solute-binding subunit [Varibaculum cambriense]